MYRPFFLRLILVTAGLVTTAGAAFGTARDTQIFVGPAGHAQACTRAAPCALATAREQIRVKIPGMSSDLHVILLPGDYQLTDTLVLTGSDSGAHGHQVIYEGDAGGIVQLSGGREIAGWKLRGDGVAVAPVPRGMEFRQLYVDGRRAVRARWPNNSYLQDGLVWNTAAMNVSFGTRVPENVNWSGVEFVVNRHWQQHRLRVARAPTLSADGRSTLEFKPDDALISFSDPGGTAGPRQPYFFENAMAFLDRPLEWFLDESSRQLFLKTVDGRLPKTVIVPDVQTLVRLQGTVNDPVHDIVFRNIVFAHAGWTDPNRTGLLVIQATWLGTPDGARFLPAAFEVRGTGAHNIRVEKSRFQHLGATGVAFYGATRDMAIVDSTFSDISAGAISVHSDPDRVDFAAPGSRNIEISQNCIAETGIDYTGTVGIFAGYVDAARIEHNEIRDVPYSAISVGWGWTDRDNGSKNNIISHNLIYRAMTVHDDGGGIYLLSKQPGTKIVGNYIHDLVRNPVAGDFGIGAIYLDNGTEGVRVEGNAIEHVPERIHLNLNNSGTQLPAKNNIIIDYTGPADEIARNAGVNRKCGV